MAMTEKDWVKIELLLMAHSEKVLEVERAGESALDYVRTRTSELNDKLVRIQEADAVADRLNPEF